MAKPHACRRQLENCAETTAPGRRRGSPANAPSQTPAAAGRVLITDLPACPPVDKRELALWRAFLADEIEAILRDGD